MSKNREYLTVRFENLKSTDDQVILGLALQYEAIPISKDNARYEYIFQATTEISLTNFLKALATNNFHISSFKFKP